jgi:ligand-binding sensor domain-containing protein
MIIILMFALALEAQPQWVSYNQVNAVTDIAFDSLNNKWVATGFGGLAKLTGNTWSVFDTLNSNIPSNRVWSVAVDKKNIIWISTNKGIGRYDGLNWTKYDTNTLLFVNAMTIDNQNVKWMSSFNHGLIKYNDTIWTYYKTDNSGIQTNTITGIGLENRIKWLATAFNGLIQFNDTSFINYNTTNSGITSNNLRSVSVDHNGDKWVGFDLAFAVKYNSKNNVWTYYNEIWPGLTSGNITFVYNDSRNVKWFGCLDALYRFNDTILVNCNPPVIGSGAFGEFKEDKYKNVWICGVGLYTYNPNGVVSVGNNTNNLPKSFIVHQNYPNPFNIETNIKYEIPLNGNIGVFLFDILGRNIATLLSENKNSGIYNLRLSFDKYSSGVYFLKFNFNNQSIVKRILLMK